MNNKSSIVINAGKKSINFLFYMFLYFFQADEDIKDDLLDDGSQSEGEGNSKSNQEQRNEAAGDSSSAPNSPDLKKRKPRRVD